MNQFKAFLFQGFNAFLSLIRKKTVGARALVVNDRNEVLLIKHTYTPGWHTIGGGVDAKEAGLEAIVRELNEEAGIVPTTPPRLFGFYYNPSERRDDYIAFYICTDFTQTSVKSGEIEDVRWFSLDALPEGVTPATRRRIAEYCGKTSQSDRW